jgi:hypothetical protein
MPLAGSAALVSTLAPDAIALRRRLDRGCRSPLTPGDGDR